MKSSLKDALLRHDRPMPRYTSYPPAPHFRAGFEGRGYGEWLARIPKGAALSLYLHVPFCPRLCWFCGCHTKITHHYAPVGGYAGRLAKEAALVAKTLGRGQTVRHLHFGGGSPSILSAGDFSMLMQTLRDGFAIDPAAEIAIEIDPRQAEAAAIENYAGEGITRISLGVQDFDERVLSAVNRAQPLSKTRDAVRIARENGIGGINLDFIYGLPYQTIDSLRRTIGKAVEMTPERISLFGYAHVPWAKKHMRLIPESALPDASARYDMFRAVARDLAECGYVQIGIDHFVRKTDSLAIARGEGRLRRNFQGYTDDNADALIGFGVSSIGRLPDGYVQNAVHMPPYAERVDRNQLPVEKFYALTPEDRLRAEVIEQLMCNLSADLPAVCAAHDFPADHLDGCLRGLRELAADGLVSISPEKIVRVADGFAARPASAAFDACLSSPAMTQTPRHARMM